MSVQSTKTPPFFSVIIATYNRKQLLERALTSLTTQTETDWEAIIIDDGSTDKTGEFVRSFIRPPYKITYIKQVHEGVISAKNHGLELARGHYITFLDSDDEYKPTHLATRKQILLTDENIDLLHGGVDIIGSSYVPDCNRPGEKIHLSKCAISGTFCIKRAALQKLGGFAGESLNTDAEFMRRAQHQQIKIEKTAEPTYVYHRDSSHSITRNYAAK